MRGALATSRRVGALLLKAEEGEMEAVAAAADDLIKREYRWDALALLRLLLLTALCHPAWVEQRSGCKSRVNS